MRKVGKILWCLWSWPIALLFFITAFLRIAFAVTFGSEETKANAVDLPAKNARFFVPLMGLKTKVFGLENVDASQNYVYVANHSSNMDPFVHYSVIPSKRLRIIAKEEILKLPMFGYVLKHLFVPVNRADRNDRNRVMNKMKEVMDAGDSMFLYAEGTRTRDTALLNNLKSGAFRLAIASGRPYVLLTTPNLRELNGPTSAVIGKGTVYCYFDGPFSVEGLTMDDVPKMIEQAENVMRDRMLIHYPGGDTSVPALPA